MQINSHPLQSPEWAAFRESWGNEVIKTPYGFLTLHKIPLLGLKLGIFEKGPRPTKEMLNYLKQFAKEKGLLFIKIEPNAVLNSKSKIQNYKFQTNDQNGTIKLFRKYGCIPGKTLFTPTTFWIDLTKSDNELLRGFHPKTRYNIRLAEKHGVKVFEDNSEKAFTAYIKLMRETVQRQGFYAHSEKYHRLMWKHLHQKSRPLAHLLLASYKKKILTTWIVFIYNKFIYYPYGASTDKYKELQANSLMMWETIKFGKKMGCTTFDLWGREEGKGFTRFKEGFAPQVIELLGTWDLVINKPLYQFYLIAEKIRWKILRVKSKFIKPTF